MTRPCTPYWQFATPTKTKGEVVVEWQCNFCKRKFKSSASRIKPHLEGIKKKGISICKKIEEYRRCRQRHDNNTANSNNPREGNPNSPTKVGPSERGSDRLSKWFRVRALVNATNLLMRGSRYEKRLTVSRRISPRQSLGILQLKTKKGSAMPNDPLKAVDVDNTSLSIPSSSRFDSLTSFENQQLYLKTASFEKLVTASAISNNSSESVNQSIPAEDVHEPLPLPESRSRKKQREVMDKSVSTGQADTEVTSPYSSTNINAHEGRAEMEIMDPNLPPSYLDITTSSHRQPQAGIAAEIMNLAGSGIPRPTRAQINANSNASTSDDDAQSYYNSGKRHIRGLFNLTGYVKGNGNGFIIFRTSDFPQSQSGADLQANVDALQHLVDRMVITPATQPNSSGPPPPRGDSHGLGKYSNTGEQTIKGLSNQ